jgi:hypothetical protein
VASAAPRYLPVSKGTTVRIRLHGTPAEMTATIAALAQVLDIHDQSLPYPDRPPSLFGRVYLDTARRSNGGRR